MEFMSFRGVTFCHGATLQYACQHKQGKCIRKPLYRRHIQQSHKTCRRGLVQETRTPGTAPKLLLLGERLAYLDASGKVHLDLYFCKYHALPFYNSKCVRKEHQRRASINTAVIAKQILPSSRTTAAPSFTAFLLLQADTRLRNIVDLPTPRTHQLPSFFLCSLPRVRQSADIHTKPAAPAPSAFAGIGGAAPTPTPGFVFGAGGVGQPSSNFFSLGAATIEPAPTTGGTTPLVSGGVRPIATGGFLFRSNTPASAALSTPPEKQLEPAKPTAGNTQPGRSLTPQCAPSSTTGNSSCAGRAFGEGKTAARGSRLNKRFSSWVSYQLGKDAASFLDSGLRDYVAFAAEIRESVDFAKAELVSTAAFRHPSLSAVPASKPDTKPKSCEPSKSATPQSSVTAPPIVVAAPAPAPSPVAQSAPVFSFSAPSALPVAPSGPHFSFALPSATASTSASGRSTATAPSASSPSGGFKFDAGGLGAAGPSPGSFKGESFHLLCCLHQPSQVLFDGVVEDRASQQFVVVANETKVYPCTRANQGIQLPGRVWFTIC